MVYNLLKRYLGPAPVYSTLGNHDTYVTGIPRRSIHDSTTFFDRCNSK